MHTYSTFIEISTVSTSQKKGTTNLNCNKNKVEF